MRCTTTLIEDQWEPKERPKYHNHDNHRHPREKIWFGDDVCPNIGLGTMRTLGYDGRMAGGNLERRSCIRVRCGLVRLDRVLLLLLCWDFRIGCDGHGDWQFLLIDIDRIFARVLFAKNSHVESVGMEADWGSLYPTRHWVCTPAENPFNGNLRSRMENHWIDKRGTIPPPQLPHTSVTDECSSTCLCVWFTS